MMGTQVVNVSAAASGKNAKVVSGSLTKALKNHVRFFEPHHLRTGGNVSLFKHGRKSSECMAV